jgi:hypothetical protein
LPLDSYSLKFGVKKKERVLSLFLASTYDTVIYSMTTHPMMAGIILLTYFLIGGLP